MGAVVFRRRELTARNRKLIAPHIRQSIRWPPFMMNIYISFIFELNEHDSC